MLLYAARWLFVSALFAAACGGQGQKGSEDETTPPAPLGLSADCGPGGLLSSTNAATLTADRPKWSDIAPFDTWLVFPAGSQLLSLFITTKCTPRSHALFV